MRNNKKSPHLFIVKRYGLLVSLRANDIADLLLVTFTFFTIEDHVKQLQAGLLTIESSYSLRLPIPPFLAEGAGQ